jgi:hypothetical protein
VERFLEKQVILGMIPLSYRGFDKGWAKKALITEIPGKVYPKNHLVRTTISLVAGKRGAAYQSKVPKSPDL